MQMPSGFVEVEANQRGPYIQRAVSADGVVIALRSETNPKDATLDFWVTAIRDELVNRRGYTLAKEEPVEAANGAKGKLLTCTANRSGAEFTYLAAVYVMGGQVLVAEAGGKSDNVVDRLDDIRKAMASLRAGGV
jgi:ABC-type sugar transport system substrate-binding protein